MHNFGYFLYQNPDMAIGYMWARAQGWDEEDVRALGWDEEDVRAQGWDEEDVRAQGWDEEDVLPFFKFTSKEMIFPKWPTI